MILAPAAGRTAIVFMMAMLPYARDEQGLGKLFYSGINRWAALSSALIFIAVASAMAPAKLFLLCLTVLLTVTVFSLICRRKIGGATGDTLGAVCELTETTVLMSFCIII